MTECASHLRPDRPRLPDPVTSLHQAPAHASSGHGEVPGSLMIASLATPAVLGTGAAVAFAGAAACQGGMECLGPVVVGMALVAVAFPVAPLLVPLGPLAVVGIPFSAWLWVLLGRRLGRGLHEGRSFRWARWWGRYLAASVLWLVAVPLVVAAVVQLALS